MEGRSDFAPGWSYFFSRQSMSFDHVCTFEKIINRQSLFTKCMFNNEVLAKLFLSIHFSVIVVPNNMEYFEYDKMKKITVWICVLLLLLQISSAIWIRRFELTLDIESIWLKYSQITRNPGSIFYFTSDSTF